MIDICVQDVRRRAKDPGALDVEDGVPPPRAAPSLLRRVVLSPALSEQLRSNETLSFIKTQHKTPLVG